MLDSVTPGPTRRPVSNMTSEPVVPVGTEGTGKPPTRV
jgi:hypothetical protein